MKKLASVLILLFAVFNIGWISESGSGVVSADSVIKRSSLEATTVLISDTLATLYGETRMGGSTNYSSVDSSGVASFRNVTATNAMKFKNNQYIVFSDSSAVDRKFGLSTDNTFILNSKAQVSEDFHAARIYYKPRTIAADATTFNASSDNYFVTSANTTPTKISSITGGITGQILYIRGGSDTYGTSFDDAYPFDLASNIRLSKDDCLTLIATSDSTFSELSRSDN